MVPVVELRVRVGGQLMGEHSLHDLPVPGVAIPIGSPSAEEQPHDGAQATPPIPVAKDVRPWLSAK
jgi:hypothetical protein